MHYIFFSVIQQNYSFLFRLNSTESIACVLKNDTMIDMNVQDLAVVVLLILIPLLSPNSSKGGVGSKTLPYLFKPLSECVN